MLDVAPQELLLVAVVALLVIGPKDLPRAMHFVGKWVGKARGVARQFRSGMDTMIREAELAEMEEKWKAENERIMREHPPTPSLPAHDPAQPMLEHVPEPAGDGTYLPDALPDERDTGPVMVEQPEIKPSPADMPAPHIDGEGDPDGRPAIEVRP